MHPLTMYDVVVQEHQHATRQRAREHMLRLRRTERSTRIARGGASRATSAARSATV